MTAGLLRLAGINMGDNIDEDNNEDQDFLAHRGDWGAFEDAKYSSELIDGIRREIVQKNRLHSVWGWKDPISIQYLEQVIELVRNPHIILVTRDSAACAFRERAEIEGELSAEDTFSKLTLIKMKFSLSLYSKSIDFLLNSSFPILLVSYERSLRYSGDLAEAVFEYSGWMRGSSSFRSETKKASEFISPDRISGNISASVSTPTKSHGAFERILIDYNKLTDIYDQAAKSLNSAQYREALDLASAINHLGRNGFTRAPHLAVEHSKLYDLDCGAHFICAVALANLRRGGEAYEQTLLCSGKLQARLNAGSMMVISKSVESACLRLQEKLAENLFS